jgi:hypothetical protein
MRSLCWLLLIVISATYFECRSQASDFWRTDFSKADSVAFSLKGHSLDHPDELAKKLVQGLTTEQEKFRAIFRWIADNIAYDYPLYLKIIRKESELKHKRKKLSAFAQRASKQMYRNMILKRETICAGYAMLLEYMCEQAGIGCEFVSGYSITISDYTTDGPDHAWNAVKLNNKWYLCDVTWAAGQVDLRVERFIQSFNETYFLTDPTLFIANHYPTEKRWTLIQNPPSLTEFSQSAYKAEGFIDLWVNQYFPKPFLVRIKQSEPFQLRFTTNTKFIDHQARVVVIKHGDKKFYENVCRDLVPNERGEYVLNHQFKEAGTYTIYIFVNEMRTFGYQVAVGKK